MRDSVTLTSFSEMKGYICKTVPTVKKGLRFVSFLLAMQSH